MINKRSDILFTLFTLSIILVIGIFLGHRVASEVSSPPVLIDGKCDLSLASKGGGKDTRVELRD